MEADSGVLLGTNSVVSAGFISPKDDLNQIQLILTESKAATQNAIDLFNLIIV